MSTLTLFVPLSINPSNKSHFMSNQPFWHTMSRFSNSWMKCVKWAMSKRTMFPTKCNISHKMSCSWHHVDGQHSCQIGPKEVFHYYCRKSQLTTFRGSYVLVTYMKRSFRMFTNDLGEPTHILAPCWMPCLLETSVCPSLHKWAKGFTCTTWNAVIDENHLADFLPFYFPLGLK